MSDRLQALGWVAATTAALAFIGLLFHFPGSFGEVTVNTVGLAFGLVLGAVSGVVVGVAQWVGLGSPRGRVARLAGAMGVGVGVSHALADGLPAAVGLPIVAGLGAMAVTAAYASLFGLRDPVTFGASFAGWAAGWLVGDRLTTAWGMPWTETPLGWAQEHIVVGVVVGLAWGGATALVGVPRRIGRPRWSGDIRAEGAAA